MLNHFPWPWCMERPQLCVASSASHADDDPIAIFQPRNVHVPYSISYIVVVQRRRIIAEAAATLRAVIGSSPVPLQPAP